MNWPEILATGLVTLLASLGTIVVAQRYQRASTREANRRADAQAAQQVIAEIIATAREWNRYSSSLVLVIAGQSKEVQNAAFNSDVMTWTGANRVHLETLRARANLSIGDATIADRLTELWDLIDAFGEVVTVPSLKAKPGSPEVEAARHTSQQHADRLAAAIVALEAEAAPFLRARLAD